MLVATVLAAGAVAGPGARAGNPPPEAPRLTIERILAGPPYAGPTHASLGWCPDGDAWWAAWSGEGDARVLEAVDAETGARRRLLAWADFAEEKPATEDAAPVPMRSVGRAGPPEALFSADGAHLVLAVRGDLFRVALATGARTRLTRTRAPLSDCRVAPDGRAVSFSRDNDLWAARLGPDGPEEVRLTTGGGPRQLNGTLDWMYAEEFDARTAAWWSPDGTRLAFLALDEAQVPAYAIADAASLRGTVREQLYPKAGDPVPAARVGVVGLDGAPPVWLDAADPGEEAYLPWAAWTPDGSRVAVAVLDRPQRRLEIRLCDPAGGPTTTLWAEEHAAWVDLPPPPRALPRRGAFLLRSRKDGWWRLWAVPLDGGAPRAVTPAGRDAGEALAVDEASGAFLWEGASDDLLRSTLLRGRLDGEPAAEPVLDDEDHHAVAASPGGRWLLDTASRALVPPTTTLRRPDGSAVRVVASARTPEHEALTTAWRPKFLEVDVPGVGPLPAMLHAPRDASPERPCPLVVRVYGGPGSALVRDAWRGGTGHLDAFLAQEGFAVLSVDGRGTGGRGKAFEAAVHRRLALLEADDQAAAARRVCADRPWIDASRVGIWGWSYGGTVAAQALVRHPEVFRAAAAAAPVTDWRLYDAAYAERYMERPEQNAAGYRETSLVEAAPRVSGALLLLHGLADDNVHAQNTWRLVAALVREGKPFDLMAYPQRGHGIEGRAEHLDALRRVVAHFRRHLARE